MKIDDIYRYASICEYVSKSIFWLVLVFSIFLLIQDTGHIAEVLQILLIPLTVLGTCMGIAIKNLQVDGNHERRNSQLRNDLNYPIGEEPKPGYYNSSLPPSLKSLGATTLENTKFTIAILEKMLLKKRLAFSIYLFLFLVLISVRQTSLNWILLICQSIFSSGVVFEWIAIERYLSTTKSIRLSLRQHFLQTGGNDTELMSVAIIISSFTAYECAKDEAGIPLDKPIYDQINAQLTAEWEREKIELGIVPN